mmetsp:Transcript_15885/g.49930  ORF Transcript_15885/g.49930 Transcript_15885/m.49930 type:complete len:224 (+) Transcript_15885:1145-1816(+)
MRSGEPLHEHDERHLLQAGHSGVPRGGAGQGCGAPGGSGGAGDVGGAHGGGTQPRLQEPGSVFGRGLWGHGEGCGDCTARRGVPRHVERSAGEGLPEGGGRGGGAVLHGVPAVRGRGHQRGRGARGRGAGGGPRPPQGILLPGWQRDGGGRGRSSRGRGWWRGRAEGSEGSVHVQSRGRALLVQPHARRRPGPAGSVPPGGVAHGASSLQPLHPRNRPPPRDV